MSKPENNDLGEAGAKKPLISMGPKAPGMSPQGLIPISHKDFNEFIKGKGFVGRNNYKLKELKAMFGFKPLTKRNQLTVTIDDGKEFNTYESMSKASLAAGIPYPTLQQTKRKFKLSSNPIPIRSGGNIYVIKFDAI